ncbi:MAG: alpha/beta hydrolase [Polyangia bacterium]
MKPPNRSLQLALVGALAFGATPAYAGWHLFGAKDKAVTARKQVAVTRHVDAIFLHGLGGEPTHFPLNELTHALGALGTDLSIEAPWLRPVRVDSEGVAHSTGAHTMTDQLARARAAIDAHEGPVVLIGHSFGGKAAIALAKDRPDKVAGVVLLAPSVKMLYSYWKNLTGERGLPDKAKVTARLAAHEQWLRTERAHAEPGSKAERGMTGELQYLATMQDLVHHDETNLELGVTVPTLHLHGIEDDAVSIHYARRFAEQNPKVKLVEFAGVDHGMHSRDGILDRAAGISMTQHINEFLKTLEAK